MKGIVTHTSGFSRGGNIGIRKDSLNKNNVVKLDRLVRDSDLQKKMGISYIQNIVVRGFVSETDSYSIRFGAETTHELARRAEKLADYLDNQNDASIKPSKSQKMNNQKAVDNAFRAKKMNTKEKNPETVGTKNEFELIDRKAEKLPISGGDKVYASHKGSDVKTELVYAGRGFGAMFVFKKSNNVVISLELKDGSLYEQIEDGKGGRILSQEPFMDGGDKEVVIEKKI